MATGKITANGSTDWYKVVETGTHIAVHGTFGGGSVAIEQLINGTAYPLLDAGTAIALTVADDSYYELRPGDAIRLATTGATTPAIDYSITGFDTKTSAGVA